MQIIWHGLSCIELNAKIADNEATVVINPYSSQTGLRPPRTLTADALLISHKGEDADNAEAIGGSPLVIKNPGEYEVKGVFVFGISAPTKNNPDHMIFRLEAEGIRIAHLGVLDREPTSEELAALENVDVLILPAGGGRVLTPKVAVEVFEEIEPRILIPIMTDLPNLKEKLGTVEAFCKEIGVCRREEATKYRFSRKDLPTEDMLVVILNRA